MVREEKQLLLVDLCGRLPYGVRGFYKTSGIEITGQKLTYDIIGNLEYKNNVEFKPYLFPLSSMTEEQLYNNPIGFSQMLTIKADRDWENITINRRSYYKLVDWFNKNHFDYRNLIDKNLAIDCTNLNIY